MKYLRCTVGGKRVLEHRAVAEKALGHALPKGSIVHHVDKDETNNRPSNLVICPNQAYHKLIHRRQDAFEAVGNYEARRCMVCSKHDLVENMVPWGARKYEHYAHKECRNAIHRKYCLLPDTNMNDLTEFWSREQPIPDEQWEHLESLGYSPEEITLILDSYWMQPTGAVP